MFRRKPKEVMDLAQQGQDVDRQTDDGQIAKEPDTKLGTIEAPYSLPGFDMRLIAKKAFLTSKLENRPFYIEFQSMIIEVDASQIESARTVSAESAESNIETQDLETEKRLAYLNGYIDGVFKSDKK